MKQYMRIFICGFLIVAHFINASNKNNNKNSGVWDKDEVDKILQDTKDTLKVNIQEAKNTQETANPKKNNNTQRRGSGNGKIGQIAGQKIDDSGEIKINETNEILVIKEENQCPLINIKNIFKNKWNEKPLILDALQNKTLGTWWMFSGDETIITEFINRALSGDSEINIKTNLSFLRRISNCIINSFKAQDFKTSRKILNLCSANKITYWTSPDIKKDAVNNKNNQIEVDKNKIENDIQQILRDTKKDLFKLVSTEINTFLSNVRPKNIDTEKIDKDPKVLSVDLVQKFKDFYALALMSHKIHNEEFPDYNVMATVFENITEDNVLKLVAPTQVEQINNLKNLLIQIKNASEQASQTKNNLLEGSTKNINIDESTFLGQNS